MWRTCALFNTECREIHVSVASHVVRSAETAPGLEPIKPMPPTGRRSAQSPLNSRVPSSLSAPEAQRGSRGMCPAPYWTVTRGTVRYEAGHGRRGVLLAAGAGARDPGVAGPGRHRSPVPPNRGMAGRGACLRARWQKPQSYRAREQAISPGGTTPRTPRCRVPRPRPMVSRDKSSATTARRRGWSPSRR
jgi:hypothetical protein